MDFEPILPPKDGFKVNDIDYVFHAFSDKEDSDKQNIFYEKSKNLNKFIEIDYSHGISTTQIINNTNFSIIICINS